MRFSGLALVAASLAGVANAHFRLLYPEPRGPFVSDQNPNFCGGYTNAVSNRSSFPLSGGVFTIRAGHITTMGVMISTVQNPNNFDNFSSAGQPQFIKPFTNVADPGTLCFPLELSGSNITGLTDGANVTIQVVLGGTDGSLYQCADLTLTNNFSPPDNFTCANETTSDSHGSGSSGDHSGSGSSDNSGNGALGRAEVFSAWAAGLLGVSGLLISVL
ncbi:hypothetical protein ONZ45_g9602 [Pleurotus djamor]|nr:hypothetical protein ONZ45_g9602 [Pleurotus djamor]